ncbi:MAG: Omp28-related outer membrane protein [Bacteroidales bacterium]|nr:Omp28-related outer membrane protein [Bacteroidales bacterium]
MKTFCRSVSLGIAGLLIPCLMLAQHYVPIEPLDKNAILEEFTGVNCPNCPAGHQVMAQILADHPGRAFCVAYHPYNSSYTTPTAGDPDFRRHFPDSLYMTPYCGTSRFMPSAFIQRRVWTPPERLMSRTSWPAHTSTILAEPSPMNVGMATSYDEANSILTVVVDIYYTEDFPGEHNLMVTLAENDLVSHQAGATYPYTHKHTFREAFVGQWGDPILTDATAGTFYRRIFTYDYSGTDYIIENCELLAFVLDNSSTEVITGIGCHAGDTTYITPDVELSSDTLVYDNPQQCIDGQLVSIGNPTDASLDLIYVQEESLTTSPFPWSVDPWPFTDFPYTLNPGESVDLNVVLPLPVEGETVYLYDQLMIVSQVDTHYVVIAVNEGLYTEIGEQKPADKSTLSMNYPNPFSSTTRIDYLVTKPSTVLIEVFNFSGGKVKTLVNGVQVKGTHCVYWNGLNDGGVRMPDGVYFYRLVSPDATVTRRCVLLR